MDIIDAGLLFIKLTVNLSIILFVRLDKLLMQYQHQFNNDNS